jgi:hypothetical protein
MKYIVFLTTVLLLASIPAFPGPLINEVSAGGTGDWVEITVSDDTESCDISQYFVTMYYGTNEKLASSPVTLRNRDLPSTPYDDRFAVIHFTSVPVEDETDATGDTNGNGVLDVYCCNYGLWNTDCVVAIDTDDDPSNGGIIDFIAFSNRDGSMNTTIKGYIEAAISAGQWTACINPNMQNCCVYTGTGGLTGSATISRIRRADTNTPDDFVVTPYATPGRENIINADKGSRKIFKVISKEISHRSGSGSIKVPLFLYETCSVKLRIFTSTGFTVYSSQLNEDLNPGWYTFSIPEHDLHGRILTGLYPVKIEAAGKVSGTETATVFLVIAGKR